MEFTLQILGSSSSSSSDDEEDFSFVEHLNRPRKARVYRNRVDNFNKWDENEFFQRFRLTKRSANIVLDHIAPDITSKTNWNHAVESRDKLLLTLWFLATNNFLVSAGDFIGIHKTTAGSHVWKVLQALAKLRALYIRMPSTPQEVADTKQRFYEIARFPNVIGAIDCTHVKIESPGGNEPELFRNRKNFFSINVQAICNAQLKFTNIVARWPGSVHDSRIFSNSRIKKEFEDGVFPNCLLLGDSGYPVTNYCVIPIHQPTTNRENLYNEAQIRTRNCIERAFGVLKRRFPVLSLGIRLDISKVQCICVVAAILHNIAIDFNEPEPPHLPDEIEAAVIMGNEVPVENINQDTNMGVMTNLLRYFENLG